MAYFDSTKNRAKWDIELAALRRERELRRQSGGAAAEPVQRSTEYAPRIVRMTYQDLLKEEAEASQKEPSRRPAEKVAGREQKKQREMMQNEAAQHEVK